jgi:hypothetical protein
MEQEPERELLSYMVKRIGYKLRASTHLAFLVVSAVLIAATMTVLVIDTL